MGKVKGYTHKVQIISESHDWWAFNIAYNNKVQVGYVWILICENYVFVYGILLINEWLVMQLIKDLTIKNLVAKRIVIRFVCFGVWYALNKEKAKCAVKGLTNEFIRQESNTGAY